MLTLKDDALVIEVQATGAKFNLLPWDGDIFIASLIPTGQFGPIVDLDYMTKGFAQFQIHKDGKLNLLRLSVADGQAYEFRREKIFDRNSSKSIALSNNGSLRLAIRIVVSFRACFFSLVITFVIPFQVVVVAATEFSNSGGLVDIGGGRKMYLECRGAGSPTVVLISGTRGAHDDWTILIDPSNPAGSRKRSESAVFPQVSKFTRVCAYDRPGTTLER